MKLPWCGAYYIDINKMHAPSRDHVVPLIRGGPNTEDNMLVVCRKCNNLKEDLTLEEYYEHLVEEESPDAERVAMLLPRYAHLRPKDESCQ